jgi:hypothetical protein
MVLAPVHCLAGRGMAAGFTAEICGPEGLRVVHLAGDEAPAVQPAPGYCFACHALPAAVPLATPVLPTPAWIAGIAAWSPTPAHDLPGAARAPPYPPTAPPVLA